MNQAAHPNDAVKPLLDCFESLKGGSATPDDYLEASRMATLGIDVQGIVACIQSVARRNGPAWRPHTLRYFAGAVADLVKEPGVEFVYTPPRLYVLPAEPKDPEVPLTREERMEWARRLRQVTRERLNHGR
jgi:hypothetical protein